jgi:hypothetical protein
MSVSISLISPSTEIFWDETKRAGGIVIALAVHAGRKGNARAAQAFPSVR